MSSQTLNINLRLVIHIYSVTSGCVNGIVVCIVAEKGVHKVHLCTMPPGSLEDIGGQRSDDGQLDLPQAAMMSDQGYIYVGDANNYHLSMMEKPTNFYF